MQERERSSSEGFFWPSIWAIGLHVLLFGMLFVSFAFTPELPPAKPIVQATLYELKSKSPATVQTNQKIAGEAKKTAAKQYEVEQLEAKKVEQEKVKAAEQKKADEAQKAEAAEQEQAEAAKAAEAKKAEEAKKVEEKKLADIAKKKTEEEQKKAEEEAKKKAEAEAKKKAAEDAKKKAADAAKKATEKKKAEAEAVKKKAAEAARKSAEDKKAQALAELLSDTTEREATTADEVGDTVSGNFDDLIRMRASEVWTRPPGARNGMAVVLQITMLPDGTITSATIAKSSGNAPFDNSAVAAVKNIGRLVEMQGLSPTDFNPYRSFKMTFKPEDLDL
ncbi:cell envelope integrity protein TolA [Pseudomonas sp. GV071]|jgi:colicin import membrane protein|uniref:cell envelope integrity protein TolA n=1 Tax=Pseudomonas sp. GV071 TaxID=2135754 RepID=UPI000D3924A6|nr:cell envelope integrity protein TolA [Pseudomonas sp. GV071]PTQ72258.1 cell division and transport-associated protein TolA [Pseudomonas sp. GV071]